MRIRQSLPAPALRPYVDRYWSWESEAGEAFDLPTLLPGTGAELFIHYRRPFSWLTAGEDHATSGRDFLLCLRHMPLALRHVGELGFLAVRFKAGMVSRFSGMPEYELHDRVLSCRDLWGQAGSDLMAQVSDGTDYSQRVTAMDDFLQRRLAMQNDTDRLVEAGVTLLYRQTALSIEALADKLCLGRRQLERRFRRRLGITACETRRLCRFQHTVRSVMLSRTVRPYQIALDYGYADQAHFNREFKQLAGYTPLGYFSRSTRMSHFFNTSHCT